MNEIENFRYVYNPKQWDFYLQCGIVPVEIGKHRKTHNIFVVFKRDDVDKVFDLWMNNKPPQKV